MMTAIEQVPHEQQYAPKFCPYCGLCHYRRSRACCDQHARKINGHKAAITAGRNRSMKRIMLTVQRRERHRSAWRAVSMTPDPSQLILSIFGVLPK